MAARNVYQVYQDNPTSGTIPDDTLIYLGLDPFGSSNDSATTFSNIVDNITAAQNHYVISNVVNQGSTATISVIPQTLYFANSLFAITFNFPGVAGGAIIGQPVEIHATLSGQKIINAPAGGYFRNDNAYWVSFNPQYSPSGAAGQFIMKFTYFQSNVWTYEIALPFSGILNGTPLLGTFLNGEPFDGEIVEGSGIVEIFSIETEDTSTTKEGDLLRNGVVIAIKGTFINPLLT